MPTLVMPVRTGHGAVDEGGAAGGAALLAVVVGEEDTLVGDAVDVGRLVAHHAAVVVADVLGADVVTPDDQDVGLLVVWAWAAGITVKLAMKPAISMNKIGILVALILGLLGNFVST